MKKEKRKKKKKRTGERGEEIWESLNGLQFAIQTLNDMKKRIRIVVGSKF